MQERIANILVDIDKSIYEINRNRGDQGIVNRLSKQNSTLNANLRGKSSTKVFQPDSDEKRKKSKKRGKGSSMRLNVLPDEIAFNNKKNSIQQMQNNGSKPILGIDTTRLENINESHQIEEATPYMA